MIDDLTIDDQLIAELVELELVAPIVGGGPLASSTLIDDAFPSPLDRYRLLVWAEARCAEDFPADLIDVVESLGDFLHFYRVKSERSPRSPVPHFGVEHRV